MSTRAAFAALLAAVVVSGCLAPLFRPPEGPVRFENVAWTMGTPGNATLRFSLHNRGSEIASGWDTRVMDGSVMRPDLAPDYIVLNSLVTLDPPSDDPERPELMQKDEWLDPGETRNFTAHYRYRIHHEGDFLRAWIDLSYVSAGTIHYLAYVSGCRDWEGHVDEGEGPYFPEPNPCMFGARR